MDGANIAKTSRLLNLQKTLNPGDFIEISKPKLPFFIRPITSDPASGKKYFLDCKLVFADYDDLICIFMCLLLPRTRIYTQDRFFDHVKNAYTFSESFGSELFPFLTERLCKDLTEECVIDVSHTVVGRSSLCEAKDSNTEV